MFHYWFRNFHGVDKLQELIEDLNPWETVKVDWRDAYDAPNGWTEVSTYKGEDQIASSVGFYWPDAVEHYITLASTIFPQELPTPECVGNVTHIPISMIQSVVRLKHSK